MGAAWACWARSGVSFGLSLYGLTTSRLDQAFSHTSPTPPTNQPPSFSNKGYGYLGVCIDSAAAIQQSVAGRCTLYPLVLGGDAKLGLMALYRDAARGSTAGGTSTFKYAKEASTLLRALAALPCDALQEPGQAAGAARRALACLPRESVFAAVGGCRAALEAAVESSEELSGAYAGPAAAGGGLY